MTDLSSSKSTLGDGMILPLLAAPRRPDLRHAPRACPAPAARDSRLPILVCLSGKASGRPLRRSVPGWLDESMDLSFLPF